MQYAKRAGNFVNVWNPNVTVPGGPGVQGMMQVSRSPAAITAAQLTAALQPRFADGTWNYTDPRHCSVHDPAQATCYLNAANRDGFYEASPLVVRSLLCVFVHSLRYPALIACSTRK